MATPNDRDKKVALTLYDRPGNEVWLEDIQQGIAAYREEIEAHAQEQGGEMREAIEGLLEAANRNVGGMVPGVVAGWCRRALALLARDSVEPILEEHDRWIDTDAIPPKAAEDERRPEVDALLWMTERLMGSSAASTMRGWLAEYRATGKLVVRDADGTVKDSLTVAKPAEVEARIKENKK